MRRTELAMSYQKALDETIVFAQAVLDEVLKSQSTSDKVLSVEAHRSFLDSLQKRVSNILDRLKAMDTVDLGPLTMNANGELVTTTGEVIWTTRPYVRGAPAGSPVLPHEKEQMRLDAEKKAREQGHPVPPVTPTPTVKAHA